MESVDCEPPGDIQVMIPYWIYRRICNLLVAVQSAAKPEDYIVMSEPRHATLNAQVDIH